MAIETKFFYTNSAEITTSNYDISIKFTRTGTETSSDALVSDDGTAPKQVPLHTLDALMVSMSASHAKALIPSLIVAVKGYEVQQGHIPVAAEIEAAWKAIADAMAPFINKAPGK